MIEIEIENKLKRKQKNETSIILFNEPQPLPPSPVLYYTNCSNLDGWTVNGVQVDYVDGGIPAPCFYATSNTYAYINPAGLPSLLNTKITFNVQVITAPADLVNFYFACDNSGAGQMLRLESRDGLYSGFATTNSWTSWNSPGGTASNIPPGKWCDIMITIDSNGYASWYMNGSLMESNFPLNVQGNYIGLIGDGGAGGYFDNIKIVPNTYTLALDGLSSGALSSLQAIYSVKHVFSTYNGPVLNLQRSTDNATSDFFPDVYGNLWTDGNGTGTSFATWVGVGTASVTIWYDQSGKNNNATQSTQSSQPLYNDSLKLLDFSTNIGNQRLALPDGTFPTGDSSYTITFKHGTITYTGANGIFGSGSPGTYDNTLSFGVYGGTGSSSFYINYWWGDDIVTATIPITVGNILTSEYTTGAGANSRRLYVNGTLNNQGTPTNPRGSTQYNNYIGYGDSLNNNYFNGQMYYMSIFSSPLSDADRAIVEGQ